MAKGKDAATAGMLEFPIGKVDLTQYAGRHANVQMTNDRQAFALKMLTLELIRNQAVIRGADGDIPVNSPARAVMWMMEQVANEAESVGVSFPK